jgi:hypothetical protein
MSKKILQINSRSNIPAAELLEEFAGAAIPISAVPGLVWKIFALDEERGEAAGLYLFEDSAALVAYLTGPIMEAMKSKAAFGDIEVKTFDVAEEATRVTRGPI